MFWFTTHFHRNNFDFFRYRCQIKLQLFYIVRNARFSLYIFMLLLFERNFVVIVVINFQKYFKL